MSKSKWDFKDISVGLRMLRELLLGRKHALPNLHNRYGPRIAPRSIPAPDIPRGPFYHYADQYYFKRHAMDSVKMPVVAPYAEGVTKTAAEFSPSPLSFKSAPTPGCAWWWDGHYYYEPTPVPPKVAKPLPYCPPPSKPSAPAPKTTKSRCDEVCGKLK